MKIILISLIALTLLSGCKTGEIELSVKIPFEQSKPIGNVEERTGYVVGQRTIPPVPVLTVAGTMTSQELRYRIIRSFPQAQIDTFADAQYAVLTEQSAIKLIEWLNEARQSLNRNILSGGSFEWKSEVRDCDNFARLFREAGKSILAYSYEDLNAELLAPSLWVNYTQEWAGVSDSLHAISSVPFWSKSKNDFDVFIVEPQNGQRTKIKYFPNREGITKIFVSGG